MAIIKLFSGMDFSGKSTTIKFVNSTMPNVFTRQNKFLTPIDTLQKMIDQNIWVSRDEFIPLLRKMVEEDVSNFQVRDPILQDTLWVIKFSARLLAENSKKYRNDVNILLNLVERYPDMDSFYITTTMKERQKRYNMRLAMGKRISRSDRLLLSTDMFEATEQYYKDILFDRFPNTQLVDTTFDSPEQIAKKLLNNHIFIKDI